MLFPRIISDWKFRSDLYLVSGITLTPREDDLQSISEWHWQRLKMTLLERNLACVPKWPWSCPLVELDLFDPKWPSRNARFPLGCHWPCHWKWWNIIVLTIFSRTHGQLVLKTNCCTFSYAQKINMKQSRWNSIYENNIYFLEDLNFQMYFKIFRVKIFGVFNYRKKTAVVWSVLWTKYRVL